VIACVPLFETVTLLSASWLRGTAPKLTTLGEAWMLVDMAKPDPQPTVAIIRPQASAISRILPHLLERRMAAFERTGTASVFEDRVATTLARANVTGPENAKILERFDKTITS
jgi:hypothetical protein